MIKNFENITFELTEEEYKLVDLVVSGLKKRQKDNPIKGEEICEKINVGLDKFGLTKKFSDARLRKITNYIRANGILPVIATSKGYYCSYDTDEIKSQIDSLYQRAEAIKSSADGLKKFL